MMPPPRARANYSELGQPEPAPTPVGLFPAGAADWASRGKLFDIAGNVWEWCNDDPAKGANGLVRPQRGGSYWDAASDIELTKRCSFNGAHWDDSDSFRLVRFL